MDRRREPRRHEPRRNEGRRRSSHIRQSAWATVREPVEEQQPVVTQEPFDENINL